MLTICILFFPPQRLSVATIMMNVWVWCLWHISSMMCCGGRARMWCYMYWSCWIRIWMRWVCMISRFGKTWWNRGENRIRFIRNWFVSWNLKTLKTKRWQLKIIAHILKNDNNNMSIRLGWLGIYHDAQQQNLRGVVMQVLPPLMGASVASPWLHGRLEGVCQSLLRETQRWIVKRTTA